MRDERDINYTTDEDGRNWLVDDQGNPVYVNGERVPGPANIINPNERFRVYDTSQGHCGLCGRLACNGRCFK